MKTYETDICIIGSGIAGTIVAKDCLEAGRNVLMIEAGTKVKGRALVLRLLEKLVRDYRIPRMRLWLWRSRYRKTCYQTFGDPGYGLSGLAVNARGGSILGWIGSAYRLKPEDFKLASLTGNGYDWPITYDELEPFYAVAEHTLRVSGNHLDTGHPPRSTPFPLPEEPFHKRDKPFLDLLDAQHWPPMHHNISLAPDGGAFTTDVLLDGLEKKSNFKLITSCAAKRIKCSSHEEAIAVECLDTKREEAITIRPKTIVVSAGGIETPIILQESANQWWPEGLGNHSGHLGCHLISHYGLGIGGHPFGWRIKNGPIKTTVVTRYFDSENEQSAGKYILLWYPAPTGYLFLNVTMEMFPNDNNYVVPNSHKSRFGTTSPTICFNYSSHMKNRKTEILERLESLAEQIGLTITHRRQYVNAHPMGTARMSNRPEDGVIDPNLRIHHLRNVYVCSSACFPTGGAANPTLSIAALAHRLGDHLTNGKSN